MNPTPRRERLRALLAGESCIHPGSVFDPISGRIADELGFEVGMLGGSIASMAVSGAPDLFVLTLTELAEQVRRICRAANLPVVVDADHGYGNALSVMRTVEELETAGAAGLTIEDTDLPPGFGRAGEERLIPVEEGIGKMRAALRARQDRSLVVAGRTSAPGLTGVEDAIRRCRAYEAEGVDALFIKGVRNRADLETICGAVALPVILDAGAQEFADKAYLASVGVRIALQGHQPFAVAAAAIHATLKALRDGVRPAELQGVPPADFVRRVTRQGAYDDFIGSFMTPQPPGSGRPSDR